MGISQARTPWRCDASPCSPSELPTSDVERAVGLSISEKETEAKVFFRDGSPSGFGTSSDEDSDVDSSDVDSDGLAADNDTSPDDDDDDEPSSNARPKTPQTPPCAFSHVVSKRRRPRYSRRLCLPHESNNLAQPQVVRGGRPVWPEHWGLTHQQIRDLLERLRQDPKWRPENSVYTLVEDFVVPWTTGHGMGYALLLNQDDPMEVNVMISHAFSENAEEFLEAVLRSTHARDVVYICALSNYQAEDGVGPSIAEQLGAVPEESPFWRVLAHLQTKGLRSGCPWRWRPWLVRLPVALVMAMVLLVCAPIFIWSKEFNHWWNKGGPLGLGRWRVELCAIGVTVVGFLAAASLRMLEAACVYHGRMVVIPNYQSDIYARLWCVYEMFIAESLGVSIEVAPTLAVAGKVSSRHAKCTCPEDEHRIRTEIEEVGGGYGLIDRSVRRTLAGVRWHAMGTWLKYTITQAIPVCALCCLVDETVPATLVTGGLALLYGVMVFAAYKFAKHMQGVVAAGARFTLGLSLFVILAGGLREATDDLNWSLCWVFCGDFVLFEMASIAVAPLIAVCLYGTDGTCCGLNSHRRVVLVAVFVCTFLGEFLWQVVSGGGSWAAQAMFSCLLAWARAAPIFMVWTEAAHLGIKLDTRRLSRVQVCVATFAVAVWVCGLLEVPSVIIMLTGGASWVRSPALGRSMLNTIQKP